MLQCILLAHADKSQIVFLNVSRPRRTCTYLPPRAFVRFGEVVLQNSLLRCESATIECA